MAEREHPSSVTAKMEGSKEAEGGKGRGSRMRRALLEDVILYAEDVTTR